MTKRHMPGCIDPACLGESLSITRRESQVLARLMAGERFPDIAAGLGLTLETVRSHVQTLLHRTRTHSQAQLVSLGWRALVGGRQRLDTGGR